MSGPGEAIKGEDCEPRLGGQSAPNVGQCRIMKGRKGEVWKGVGLI